MNPGLLALISWLMPMPLRVFRWLFGWRRMAWLGLICLCTTGCGNDTGLLKRADRAAKVFHERLSEGQFEEILETVAKPLREEAGDDALRAEFTRLSVLGPPLKYKRVSGNVVERDGTYFVALSLQNEYRSHTTVEELAFIFKGKKTWISRLSVQVNPKRADKDEAAARENGQEAEQGSEALQAETSGP
jgi:hypothetical protein